MDYIKEEYKDAFVIEKLNNRNYEEYYICYTLLELYTKLKDMLENKEFASYRVLFDNSVKWFIFNEGNLKYYVDNFESLLRIDLKLKKAHTFGVTEEEIKEVEKAPDDYKLVDLENLNEYNGVVQVYPKKPYPEYLIEYYDFLIKEVEKEMNEIEEEEEYCILATSQQNVLKLHQNFYV